MPIATPLPTLPPPPPAYPLFCYAPTFTPAAPLTAEPLPALAPARVASPSSLHSSLQGRLYVGQQLPGKPAFHARWQQRLCIVAGPRGAVPAEHRDPPRDNTPTTPAPLRGVSAGGGSGAAGGGRAEGGEQPRAVLYIFQVRTACTPCAHHAHARYLVL